MLNRHRPALARLAAHLYPPPLRVGDTNLITKPGWLPAQPVELGDVRLTCAGDGPAPTFDGAEPQTAPVRPWVSRNRRYPRYSDALAELDRPRLFEDRPSWRLTGVLWSGAGGQLGFGPTSYFTGIDIHESLAHELASLALDRHGALRQPSPIMRDLPFRRLIGDPFDLSRRPVLASIDTLTIRREAGKSSFILHRRDPGRVAVAGGLLQVVPAGIFQPSSTTPGVAEADFDLWRNIMREFSEELLGQPEHGRDGRPVRYDRGVFDTLGQARREGHLRVYCLGVAVDALTLVGEVLTVLVIDAEVFDHLAGSFVDHNDEGALADVRVPFTEDSVDQVLRDRIAPAGAGCLRLAWRHRDQLGA